MRQVCQKLFVLAVFVFASISAVIAQPRPDGSIVGEPVEGQYGITETVAQIMARDPGTSPFPEKFKTSGPEHEVFLPGSRPMNPDSPAIGQWPPPETTLKGLINRDRPTGPLAPVNIGANFQAITSAMSGWVPPDTQMAVGPSQILVVLNGRITVFDETGVIGALNTTTDSFFGPVRSSSVCDPRVRFDKHTNRWFIVMIDMAPTSNRVVLAVSSGPVITGSSSFTLFQFQFDTLGTDDADIGKFFDFPSLGVDEDALYIGGNVFPGPSGTCFVVRKSSMTSGGPIVVTPFRRFYGYGEGPASPQGVSNWMPSTNEGYFIGTSSTLLGKLIIVRISNPGTTPTRSPNINLTVPNTAVPNHVYTPLDPRPLDGGDDRLTEAHIRKNRLTNQISLWTCHTIRVNNTGTASATGDRNAIRWYEIRNVNATPTLTQAGTGFDPTTNAINYWVSGINTSGQGITAIAPCGASTTLRPRVSLMSRLHTDPLGTFTGPVPTVASSAGTFYDLGEWPQRWGDYANVAVDPNDDQTLWAAQEYVSGPNTWAVRIFEIQAPPPQISSISPTTIAQGETKDIVITGDRLYDTEAGFYRLEGHISGGGLNINSITLNSATQVTLNVTANSIANLEARSINIANPDGQTDTLTNVLTVIAPNPAPTLSFIGPTVVDAGDPAFTLVCTGTNFIPTSVVQWGGSPRPTTFISSTQVSAQISAADIATAGLVPVTVFTPAPGGGTTAPQNCTVANPVPTLTALAPPSITAGGPAFTLTCTGTGFNSQTFVKWNNTLRPTIFVNSTTVQAAISASDIANGGTANVRVSNPPPAGGDSFSITYTISNPVPALSSISPSSVPVGSNAITLTCTGTNFVPGSVVRWNGNNRTTTFVNSTTLTASIPATDLDNSGTFSVTIFSPSPGGGTSAAQTFSVNNLPPTLTAISPTSTSLGGSAFTLSCAGANFVPGAVVRWNGSARPTTFVSATLVTATISAADIAVLGSASITVLNPTPGGGTSGALTFNIVNPVPVLSLISPSSTTMGGGFFTLTCTGSNFVAGSFVRWNGQNRTTTFVNSTTLTASIPASDIVAAGVGTVTVVTPAPGGGTSASRTFTINNPVPVLTTITPNFAPLNGQAFTLTCTGSNFTFQSIVRLNGLSRTTTFVNSTTLTAQIGAGDINFTGPRTITVFNTTPGGGTSNSLTLNVAARVISGTVNLPGYSSPIGVPIQLRFRPAGGAPGTEVLTQNLANAGPFSINSTLPNGQYDIYADGSIWLQRRIANVAFTGASVSGLVWDLPAGDIDGDGAITPADYGIWAVNNGSFVTPGESGDLDGDGAVTPSDYGIWAENNGLFDDD